MNFLAGQEAWGRAMQRMSLHLRGPVRRPLWNRLRRLVQSSSAGVITAVLAGGTLYVASAVEPNLSGVWVREDGTELRMFHVGSRLTAIFEEDAVTSFEATFSSTSNLEGYINLWWQEEDMRKACGHKAYVDDTFEALVNQRRDIINYKWTKIQGDQETCALIPSSSHVQHRMLRRKTE